MRTTFFLAGLVLLTLTACDEQAQQQIDPTGIYLHAGGREPLVIKRDTTGSLVLETFRPDEGAFFNFSNADCRARLENQRLIITAYQEQRPGNEALGEWIYRFELGPSPTITGDWDLLAFGRNPRGGNQIAQAKPLTAPAPSYLHRVDDWRVIDYFAALPQDSPGGWPPLRTSDVRPAPIAQELLDAHPDDLYVRSLYLDSLIRKHDYWELRHFLDEWRPSFHETDDRFLLYNLRIAERALKSFELSTFSIDSPHKNADFFLHSTFRENNNLEQQVESFPKIFEYEEYLPLQSISAGRSNYTNYQTPISVMDVYARIFVLQGRREKALELWTASYYTCQLMENSDPPLVVWLISLSMRQRIADCLELYALNCCETLDDYRQLQETLEMLNRHSHNLSRQEIQDIIIRENPLTWHTQEVDPIDYKIFFQRHYLPNAKFQILRAVVAARLHFLTHQKYPERPEDFTPFLPGGLPDDPFGSEPLKFIHDQGVFTVYSIGQNGKDERAQLDYNRPFKGWNSDGDILVRVPREREYPFPRDGVRAASEEELWRIFPNGLPRDPFVSSNNPRPLNFIFEQESTTVYSVGPDGRDELATQGQMISYDPTNGAMSIGNIYLRLPRKKEPRAPEDNN